MEVGSLEWKKVIEKGSAALGVKISEEHAYQFAIHASEMVTWNRKINLTAITDSMDIAVKHFIDSLACTPFVIGSCSLLDIGSGGGFPGIPVKIMNPALSVTLLDSSRKKVNFQKSVIRKLKLERIEAVHARAEQLVEKKSKSFDIVISRALASLETFALLALPFVADNGSIVSLKKNIDDSEIKTTVEMLKNTIDSNLTTIDIQVKRYRLPYLNLDRSIIQFKFKKLPFSN